MLDKDIEILKDFIEYIRFDKPAKYGMQQWFLSIENILEKVEDLKEELITKEQFDNMKRDKEHAEMRFIELNKLWHRVINKLLGKNYYNDGCDWKTCDEFAAEDLINKYEKRWWQFWRKI